MIISKDAIKNILNRILKLDKKVDSHTHTITQVNNLQSTLDSKASSTHNHDSVYVKKDGSTPITGSLQLNQGSYVLQTTKVDGTYVFVAEIKIWSTYQNRPIKFEIVTRGHKSDCTCYIQFKNHWTNDPDIESFGYTSFSTDYSLYLIKAATSTWNLYIKKTEDYDSISITDFSNTNTNTTITWKNEGVSTLPDGGTYATPLQHAISDITNLQTTLNGKASSSHTHTKSQITDMPTSMKNPNSLTLQFNGTTNKTYDGSSAQTLNITPSAIGAAASNHSHSYLPLSGGSINGTVNFKGEQKFTYYDYSDPAPSVACSIKCSGNLAASAIYEGATLLKDKYATKSHTHTIDNVTGLQDKLNELFQSGNNGKNTLETSIIAKGGIVSKSGSIATFNELSNGIKSIKSLDSSLNIFTQVNEPSTKDGLWIKTDKTFNNIVEYSGYTISNIYTKLTDLPYGFYDGSAVSIGNYIYLLGGTGTYKYNYKYDTTTDSYTKMTAIPYEFYGGSAIAIGNDIYLLGGGGNTRCNCKYNTIANTYTTVSYIPYSFTGSAVGIGKDIYLLGGGNSDMKVNYKYDSITNTYARMTDIPYEFQGELATIANNNIHIFGCYYSTEHNKSHYKYDITTNTYTKLADLPYSYSGGGSIVSISTDIFILGNDANKKNTYKYDTITDTYTKMTDIPYEFYNGSATIANNNIYLLGSSSNSNRKQKYKMTFTYKEKNSLIFFNQSLNYYLYKTKLYNFKYYVLNNFYFNKVSLIDQSGNIVNAQTYLGDGTSWKLIY